MMPTALAWELERPGGHITINERTENATTDGKASVGLGVHVAHYREDWLVWPSDGDDDIVDLRIVATANTRKIISYCVLSNYYSWHDNLPYTVPLGDDDGVWIWMEGIIARFYGGPNSAEYDSVWISSNGFINFDPCSASTNPYYSYSIPDLAQPNTFAAPFWRDLKPNLGGSITYGIVYHRPGFGPYIECFAISWNHVPDKYGNLLTFQVLIENALVLGLKHRQSRIWFQYKSVTLNDQTTVGIEDQQGERGTSYNYLSLSNETTLLFEQSSNSAFIGYLTIRLGESEVDATTKIDSTSDSIRGYNVILNNTLPDDQSRFAFALSGGIVLLAEGLFLLSTPPTWVAAAGFMIGTFLYTAEQAHDVARQQAEAQLLEIDSTHAKARATDDPDQIFISNAVDANFGIIAYWILSDQNNKKHDLSITAELTYIEYDAYASVVATPSISTSVTLKMSPDDNNELTHDKATKIFSGTTYNRRYVGGYDKHDYYQIDVPEGYKISVYVCPALSSTLVSRIYICNPSGDYRANSDYSTYPYVSFIADSTGYWFIEVQPYGNTYGFYSLTVSLSQPGSGGGGCPYVSTWDGNGYALDNNLLPASESSGCADVTDHYLLQQILTQREDGDYSLLLSEFEDEHSFFDYVQLIAVDHASNVRVAASPHGEILTYTHPSPPILAVDNNYRSVRRKLTSIDGKYYESYNGSYITLYFGDLDISQGAKLVLRADYFYKRSIHVQIQDLRGNWNTVATIIPRVHWATEIVDITKYLSDARGNLKVRLYFTANHKLDFVGLDTSPQAPIQIQEGQLISADHTPDGDITPLLLYADSTYTELTPNQQIQLLFTLPPQTIEARNYIIIAEGHYYAINP